MVTPIKILLTGFEPFGQLQENPSQIIVEALSLQEWENAEVRCMILPVEFVAAKEWIADFYHGDWLPDIILHFGVARSRNEITLERFAVNMMDTANGDNAGYFPDEVPIVANAPMAYQVTIPCKRIVQYLKSNGYDAKVSNSAGTFVCNTVLFTSLHFLSTDSLINSLLSAKKAKCGFIHIPLLENMDKNLQLTTLKTIIQWLVKDHLQQEYQESLSLGNAQ